MLNESGPIVHRGSPVLIAESIRPEGNVRGLSEVKLPEVFVSVAHTFGDAIPSAIILEGRRMVLFASVNNAALQNPGGDTENGEEKPKPEQIASTGQHDVFFDDEHGVYPEDPDDSEHSEIVFHAGFVQPLTLSQSGFGHATTDWRDNR